MPHTLAAAVGRFVNPTSRSRGESYFRSGRVSAISADSTYLSATVRGTRPYDVSLTLDKDRLIVDCTCPYFDGSIDPCKHIWAAILAADQARVFQVPADLRLDFDDEEIDVLELDDPGDDYLERKSAPLHASGPAWQTFLSQVIPPPNEALPARALQTGELIYVFDLARSVTARGLMIELLARERKKSGD